MRLGNSHKGLGIPPKGKTMVGSPLTLAGAYVREAVAARRDDNGLKRAIGEVARMLGLSERRCRAFVHGEVRQVLADEWLRIEQQHRTEMQVRLARIEREAAALRAQLGEHLQP